MSEIAIIASEYYELVTLFRKINHSALLLKKHHYQLQGPPGQAKKQDLQVRKHDLVEARRLLVNVLHHILVEMDNKPALNERERELLQVSRFFVNHSKEHHNGDESDLINEEHGTFVSVEEPLSSRIR